MTSGAFSASADERSGRWPRSWRGRVIGGLATVVLGFSGGRGVITHSTAGVVAFAVFAVLVAVVVASRNPVLRPVPVLLLGVFLGLVGFVGIGGAHNTRVGWFSLVWLALGAIGLIAVLRAGPTTATPVGRRAKRGKSKMAQDDDGSGIPVRTFIVGYGFLFAGIAAGLYLIALGRQRGELFPQIVGILFVAFIAGAMLRGLILRRRRGYWGPQRR